MQHSVMCGLAIWLRFCGWLIGQHIDITAACCAGPQPDFMAGIRHFFPCPVRYNRPVNLSQFQCAPPGCDYLAYPGAAGVLSAGPHHLVIDPQALTPGITHRIREILGMIFARRCPVSRAHTPAEYVRAHPASTPWSGRALPTSG